MIKNLPATREAWVQPLNWEDHLEEGMATNSSILAWKIPTDRGNWWRLQSMGSQRVGHNRATKHKPNNGLVFTIYKYLSKLNKKINNLIFLNGLKI